MATVQEFEGKGCGLVTQRSVKAGEIVLTDFPVLLVVEEDFFGAICSGCLHPVRTEARRLCHCGAVFCCPRCQEQSKQSAVAHSEYVCQSLSKLDKQNLSSEDATSLRFLLHVKAAKAAAAARSGQHQAYVGVQRSQAGLWEVCEKLSYGARHPLASELHRRLTQATGNTAGLTVDEVDSVLRKEAGNSFGIMAASGPEAARVVRGGGLYPFASLLNHDCLPNTARVDGFDSTPPCGEPGETRIVFKALHDLPAGEELTISYFPLTVPFRERQKRCRELYGFECRCARCKEEATYESSSEDEDGTSANLYEVDAMECEEDTGSLDGTALVSEQKENIDSSYIQMYLMKYVCPREECQGTLVPEAQTDLHTCNMCGLTRTEADFVRSLQEYR